MIWIIYALIVITISIAIGLHLGRFRIAYTEMSGMMLGMTMGMLNGFLLGYASAAVTNSMFWGNLFGILLGLGLGVYYGRSGGLMGIMDGGMGGVMGGSMGAMLAVMVAFPQWAQGATAVLLSVLYVLGMAGLVALIEQSAPDHAALHRVLPMFTRAMSREAVEEAEKAAARSNSLTPLNMPLPNGGTSQRRVFDYYALLGVPMDASHDEISEAYLESMDELTGQVPSDDATVQRLERALTVLTNPSKRQAYDLRLREGEVGVVNQTGAGATRGTLASTELSNSEVTAPVIASIAARSVRGGIRNIANGSSSAGSTSSEAAPEPDRSASAVVGDKVQHARASTSNEGSATKRSNAQSGSKQVPGKSKSQGQGRGQSNQTQQVKYGRMSQTHQTGQRQHRDQKNTVVAIPWVGGVVVVVLLLAFGWLALSKVMSGASGATGSGSNAFVGAGGETQAQLEQQAVVAQVGADGTQTVDVVLNSATFQYEPKVVKVKKGAPVHFNLSVKNGDPG